ncbi:uncharacterized protein LOC106057313 isoform X3 [Biomphalaria glabrata]|uniref:Phosphodiesterase n=1 Tax=Biomphalaria glabrata TaxID=6526 RepID=A0A9W3B4K3_BIOGL|nr:uncharacterized protein LOC106057313 isoform X3 [Biomphalaria glabrata]
MGIVFSHTVAAGLYYFRNGRSSVLDQPLERNGQQQSLLTPNQIKPDLSDICGDTHVQRSGCLLNDETPISIITEALMPVLDANNLTELREAIKLTISRCVLNTQLIKVFLRDPLTSHLVDEHCRPLPNSRFISDILHQKGKTVVSVNHNQDSIRELLGSQHSNDNNHSVLLLPIPERGTHRSIGLIVVVSQAGSLSSVDPKRVELCLKQISVTYEVVKNNLTKENAPPHISNLLSLIQLCGELNDPDAAKLEIKVVRYLQRHTDAESGFLLLVVPETQMLFCQAVGDTVLQEEVRFAGPSSCFAKALETKQPITLADIPVERRHEVEKIIRRQINTLLCVPVCVSDSKDLLALACVVNKSNNEQFTQQDIDTILQCFKYTATVLTSTLAFQNERKLKNQTQALLLVARKLFTRLDANLSQSWNETANLNKVSSVEPDSGHSAGLSGSPRLIRCQGLGPTSGHCSEPGCIAQLINSLPTNQAQNTLIVLPLSAFRGSDQSSSVCRPESCLVERAHSTVRHHRSDSESSSEYSTASSSAPSSNQPLLNNDPNKKPSLDMKSDKSTDPTICGEHNVSDHRSIADSSTCFYFKQNDDLAPDVGLRLRDQHEDMTMKELEFNRYFFNNLEQFKELLSAVDTDNVKYASPEFHVSPVLNTSPLANVSSMTSMSPDIMKDYFQCEDNVHLPDKQIHKIDNYTQCESCKLKPDIRSRTFRKFKSPDQTFFGQKQGVKSALQSKRSNSISLQSCNIKMLSHTSLPPEKGSHCSTRIKNTLSKQCRSLSNNRNMVNSSSLKVDAGYCKKNKKPVCRLCRSVSNSSRSRGVSLSPMERKKTSTVVEVSTDSVYQVVKPSAQCGIEDVSDEASFHSLSDEDFDLDNTDTSIQRLLTSIQDSSRNDLQCSLVLKVKKCSTEERSDLFQLDSDLGLQNTNDKSVAGVQVGEKDEDSVCTLGVGKSCHSNEQGFALLAENFTTDELVTYPDPCRTTLSSPLNQQASVAQLTGERDDELVTYPDPCRTTHSSPLTEQASVAQLTGEGDHLTSAVDRHIELCTFGLAFGDSFEPVGCLGKDPVLPVSSKQDSSEQILKVEDIVVVQNEETQFIQGSNNNDNNCDYFQDAFDCFQETKMDYSHCMKYIETDHFQSDLIACELVESAHVVSVVRNTDEEVSIKIHLEDDLRRRALRCHNNEFISDGELDYKDQSKNGEDANCVTGINAENFTCASRVLESETNVKTHHWAYHLEQGVDSSAPRDVIPSAIDLKHLSSGSEPQFVEELSILWEGSLLSQQDEESMSVTDDDVKDLESLNGSEESNLNLDLDMCSVYLEETNYEDVASSHVIRVPGDLQQTEPIVTSSIKTDTWEINSLIREYKKRFLEDNISLPSVETHCRAELAFKKSDATTEIECDPSLKTETEENKDLSLRSHFLNINTDNVSTCKQTDIRAEKLIKSGVIWSQEINSEVEHCLVSDNIQMFNMNSDLTLHQDLSVEQTTGCILDQECPNVSANVVNLDSSDNIAVADDFIFYPDMCPYEIHLKEDSDSLSSDMSLKEDSRNVHISVASQDYSQQEESDQEVNEESDEQINEESNQEVNEKSDQQINEESHQQVNGESDLEVNEEFFDQQVYEESDQEVKDESDQEVNEESYQEVNEESDQQVNEESDQEVNEEFFDQQVNEESYQEVNEKSDQQINEESHQQVNDESDQQINEEFDQQVNDEREFNKKSDQEVNEEFDQQVKEETDQQVNEEFNQEINEESDQEVNEESDQVIEEFDQQVKEESDQQVNEEFDQQVNEEFDQEINEESDQEVNEESDQQVNEEFDQEVNEESDQEVNEESDQQVNEETDPQVIKESDQQDNEKSDQEVNDDIEFNKESDQVNDEIDIKEELVQEVNDEIEIKEELVQEVTDEIEINKVFDHECYDFSEEFKKINDESDQDVNDESDQDINDEIDFKDEVCQFNDEIDFNEDFGQQVNDEIEFSEESDQKVNEEFDQEVTYETDFNKEFDQQLVNERDFKPHHHEKDLNIESNQEVETKLDVQHERSLQIIFTTDFSQKLNLETNGEICSLKKSNQQNVVAINTMRITEQIKLNEELNQILDEINVKKESSQILDDINFNADSSQIQKDIDFNADASKIQKDIDFNADASQIQKDIDFNADASQIQKDIDFNADASQIQKDIDFNADASKIQNDINFNADASQIQKDIDFNADSSQIQKDIDFNADASQIQKDIDFNADSSQIQKDIDFNADASQIQKDIDFNADASVVLDEINYIEEACYLIPVKNHLTRELNLQSQENKDLVRNFYQVHNKTSYIKESNQKIPEEKDATEKYFHQESIHQSHEKKYFNEESSHENHDDKDLHEEAIQCNLDEEESSQQIHNVKDFDDESNHYIQDVKLSQQIHDEIDFKEIFVQYIHDEIGFNEEPGQQSQDDFNEEPCQQSQDDFNEEPCQQSQDDFNEEPGQQSQDDFNEEPGQQSQDDFNEEPGQQSHDDFNEEAAQPIHDDDLSLQIQEEKDICMKSSEQIYYKEDYIAYSGQQSHDETDLKEELHPKNQNKINLFQKLNPQIINKIASCDTLNFPMNDEIDFTYESIQHKSYESGITQKYVESFSEDQQIFTALDSNEESREPMCPDLDWNQQFTPSSDTLTLIQETIEQQVTTEVNVHSQTIPSLPNKTNALFIQDTQGIIKELGLIKLKQPMEERTTEGEEHHLITAMNFNNDELNEEHNKCNDTNNITADNQQIILYKIESKKMNEQVLEEDICTEISDRDILKVSCDETSSHYTDEVFIEAFSQLIHDDIVEVSSQQSDYDVSKQQSDNEIDPEDVIVSSLGQINGPLINILHLEALSDQMDVCEYDNDVVCLDSTQCLPTDLEIKYDEGSLSFLLETADELEKTELLSYPTRVQDTTFHYEMGGQMYEIEEEKLYQLAQEILGESPEQEEIFLEKTADLNYCCLDYASQEPVVRRQDVYLTKDLFLTDSSREVILHTDSVIETKCGSSFDQANSHLKWADRSNRESDLQCEAHLLPEHYVKMAQCATCYHLPDTDKEHFEPFENSTDSSIDEVTGLKHVSLGSIADALSPKRPLTISYSDHDIAIGFFNSQSFPLLDDQSMSLPDMSICSHFDWSQNSNRPMTRFSDATDMRSWSSVPSVHKKMSPFDSQLRKTKSDQNLKLWSPRYSWSPSTQNSFYVHPKPWHEHQQANDLSPLCISSSGTLNTSSSSLGQNISATAQRILKEDEEIRSDSSTKGNIAAGYSRHLKDSFTYGEFSRDLSHLKSKYQSGFKSMPRNDMEDLSLKTESNTKRIVKAIRNNLHSSYARSSDILKTLYEPETTSFQDPNSQPDFKSNWKSSGDNERGAFRYHSKKITDDFSELDHVYTRNNLEHGQGFNEHLGQPVGFSSQSCLVGQESEHMSTSRKRYITDYSHRTWNESDLNLTADDTDFLGDFKKPLPFDHTKYYKNKIHGSNTYMTFSCPKDETYGRLIFHQHNHGDESQIPSHSHFQSSFMDYLNTDSRQHRVSFLNEKTNFDLSTESGLDSSMTDSLFDGILDKGSDDSFECHFLSSRFAGARGKENNNHYDETILESSLAEEVSSRDDIEDTFNECMLMNNKEMEDHGFVTPAFTNRGINAILAEDTSEGSDSGESDPMENSVYPDTDAPNVCFRKTLAKQKDVKESDVKRGYVDRENQDPLTLGHLDCNLAGGPLNLNINVVLQVSKSQNTSENLNYAKLVAFNSVSTQFSLQNSIGNSEALDDINIEGLQSALQDYQSRGPMLSPVLEVLDDDPASRTDELNSDCSPGEDTQASEHVHENCVLKEDKMEDPPDISKYKPQNESSEENSEDFITLETDKITKVVYKSKTEELKKEGLGDGVAHVSVGPKSLQLSDAKEDVCVSAGDNAAVSRLVEALKQLHSCALQSIPSDGSKPDHQFVSLMNKEMLQMLTLHDTPVNSPPSGRSYLNDDKPHNESCSSEDTLSLRRSLAEDQQEKYVHTCASQSLLNKSEFQGDQNQIPEIINSDKRTTLVTGVLKPLNGSYNLVKDSTHDTFISQTPLSPRGYRDTIINRSVSTDVMGNGSLASNLFTNSSKSLDILSEGMRREGTSIFSKIRGDYSRDTQQQNAFTKGILAQDALRSDKHLTSDSRAQDAPVDNFEVIDKSLKPRISCPQLISKDSQKSLYCHFSDGNVQKLKQHDELVISRPQNLLTTGSQNREDNFPILNSVWPKLNKTQSLQSNNYELNSFAMNSPDRSTKLCYQRDLGCRCRSHGALPRISEAYEIFNSNSLPKKDFIMEHQVSDIDTSRTHGAFPQEMSLCNTHTPYNASQQVHNSIIGSKDACSGQKDELSISTQEFQAKTFNLQPFGLVNAITSKHACTSANISDTTREIHTQSDVDTILNAVTKEKTTSNDDVFLKVEEETSHEKAGKESTGQLGCNGDNNQIRRGVTIQERHVFEKLKVTSTSKSDIKIVRDLEDDKEARLTKQIWKAADVSGDVGDRVFFDQSKRENNMWASRDQSNALINGHGVYKIGDSNGDGCIKSDDCHAIKSVVPLTDIDHMKTFKSDSHGRPEYTETSNLPIADLVPADETVTMENKAVGSSVQTQEKCVETDNCITNEQWSNAEMDPLFKSPYLESTTLNIKQNDLLKLFCKTDVCLKEIKLVLLNKDMVQAQVDSNGKTDQSSLGLKHLTQKLSSVPIIVTKDDVNLNEENIELQKNRFKSPIPNSSYFSAQHNKCLEPVQDQHTKELFAELEADEQSFKSVCEMIGNKRDSSNDTKQIQDPHHSSALEDQQISTPLMDKLASPLLVDFLSCSSESCDSEWQSTFSQSGDPKFYDTFPKVISFDHSKSSSESSFPDITDFDESNLSSDEDTRDADVSSLDTTLIAPSYSEKYRLSQPIKYQSLFRKRHGSNQTKSDLLFHKDNPEVSLFAPNLNLVQEEIIGNQKDNVDSCAADVESLSDFAKVAAPIKCFPTIPFSVAPITDRFPSFFKTQSCQDKKNTTEKQSVFKQRGCQQERYNSFILADKSGKHKARASDLAGQLYSPRVSPKKHLITEGEATPGSVLLDSFYSKPVQANHWLAFKSPPSFRPSPTNNKFKTKAKVHEDLKFHRRKKLFSPLESVAEEKRLFPLPSFYKEINNANSNDLIFDWHQELAHNDQIEDVAGFDRTVQVQDSCETCEYKSPEAIRVESNQSKRSVSFQWPSEYSVCIIDTNYTSDSQVTSVDQDLDLKPNVTPVEIDYEPFLFRYRKPGLPVITEEVEDAETDLNSVSDSSPDISMTSTSSSDAFTEEAQKEETCTRTCKEICTTKCSQEEETRDQHRRHARYFPELPFFNSRSSEEEATVDSKAEVVDLVARNSDRKLPDLSFFAQQTCSNDDFLESNCLNSDHVLCQMNVSDTEIHLDINVEFTSDSINSEESRDQMTVSLQQDLGSFDTNNVNTTAESNDKELDISKEAIISELGPDKEAFSQVKLCTENSISNNRTSHESKEYAQPLQCLIDKTFSDDIKERGHVSHKYNLPLANIKTDETFVDSEDDAATLLRHLKEMDLTLETDSDLSFTGQFDSPTKSTYHIDVSCVVHVEDCDSEASSSSSLILSSGHEISISAEWKTDSEEPSETDNAIVKNIVSPLGADDLNQAFNAGTTSDQKDDDIDSHLNITYVLDESNESPESTSHKNDACDDLEDDMNASSEAYSDNMERLGSSDEHLGDDSGDSPSDSDILLHTSSIIKDPMVLKRLTSEPPVKQKPAKEDRSVYSLQDSSLVVPTLSSDSFSTYCSHQSHLVDELELAAFLSDDCAESQDNKRCHLDCSDIAEDDRLVSDSSVRKEEDFTELTAENDGIVNKSSNSEDADPEEEKLEEGFLIHSEGLDSTESLTQWTDQVSPHGSRLCYYHLYFDQTGAEVDTSNENSILDVHVSETSGLGVEKLSQDGLCQMEILQHVSEPLDPNVLDTRDSKVEDENAMVDSSKLQSENLCDFKINLAPCSLVSHSLRDQTSESSSQSGLIGQSDLCQLDDLFAVSSLSDPDMTVTEELHHEGPDTCILSFSFSNPMFCHCQGGEKKRYSSFISLSPYPCLRKSKSDHSVDSKSLCQNWILQNNSFHDTQHLMFPEDKRTGGRNTVSDISDFRRSANKGPEYQYEEMTSFSADWSSNCLLVGEDKSGDKVEDLNQCVLFEEDSKEMVTQESGTTEDISFSCHPVSSKFSLADLVQHLMARDQLKNFGFCDDDLTKLLREIMQEARNLTDAERCSVFLLDKDTDELVAMVFDGITADDKEVQGEIRLPKTQGIAGHVATTGTLLNIRDAYSHPLFYRGIDDSTGFRTRNILCFPIKDEEGMVLGVAQLCNKKTFQYFTTFDEDIASAFAVYCCISISHSLMYKKLVDIQHRHRLANELMIFHINQQVPMEEVQMMAENPILPVTTFSINFDSFDFAPRTIPESQTVMSCISMFEDLGFLSRWRIKIDTLVRFLLMVKKGYRNPPYHNWMHAYAVTHFCYLLIKNLHLHNYLDDIELLALFVSCLCHDIDHRGTTNSFQVQSQSVLAALYSSEGSVMERHHLAQSMCILNTDGSNLFENLSSKEYQTVLDLMREIILATDLAHHLRTVKEQEQLAESDSYDRNNAKHKHILLCLLMTACDLSDQTKNWNNTKHIAALVYQEFFSQGDLEKALGKNPMEMMDRERACIPELQISFLDNIAAPVYKILARMFTEAQIPARNVEENRKHWVHIRQLLKFRHGNSTQAMSVEQIISIEEEVDEIPGQGDIHLNGR